MIYFDNAATSGEKPHCVRSALLDALRRSANPGRASHSAAIRAAESVEETRELIASFVDCKKANVIFTKNCTEALNLALLGTARLGGHVVTTVLEHNSVLRPLTMTERESLISVTYVKGKHGIVTEEDILAALTPKTYLVAVTAMSNVTGYAPPLKKIGELCANRGIKFAVDGAQALGHDLISMDECGIDFLCGAGHKGLLGVMGSGFLVYRKRFFVTPLLYGGTGTESNSLKQPADPPESLESGTLNYPGIAALGAGIRFTQKHFKRINDGIKEISLFLHDSLKEAGIPVYSVPGSPILSFLIPGTDSGTVADVLDREYGIAVRAGLHCAPLIHRELGTTESGLVRVSLGYQNTMRQAKKLLRTLRVIAHNATK